MTSAAVQEARASIVRVEEMLRPRAKEIQALSPFVGITAEYYISAFKLYAAGKPKILECTPSSIVTALMRTAQVGLDLGVTCDLAPFALRKQNITIATFMARYQGLIELAYASGKVRKITAGVVRKGDEIWDYMLGSESYVKHRPTPGNLGPVTFAWASAQVTQTSWIDIVLDRFDLDKLQREHANPEHAKQSIDDPGFEWWPRKTAIRHLCNLLPKNPRFSAALRFDGLALEEDETPPSVTASATIVKDAPPPAPPAPMPVDVKAAAPSTTAGRPVSELTFALDTVYPFNRGALRGKKLRDLETTDIEEGYRWAKDKGGWQGFQDAAELVLESRRTEKATESASA